MQIKTLAEILAESDADSAKSTLSKSKETVAKNTARKPVRHVKKESSDLYRRPNDSNKDSSFVENSDTDTRHGIQSSNTAVTKKPPRSKGKKRKKRFHPAAPFSSETTDTPIYQPPEPQSIQEMLAEVKNKVHGTEAQNTDNATEANLELHVDSQSNNQADNLPSALKAYLRTPEQRQAEVDAIKAESRLRWLAFYYLSRREYGKTELKQKLLDKEQDPDQIDALLDEFEQKGYQSDYRTTLMLIRENIRKGRGRGRIEQEFYRKKVAMPDNIDELIDIANAESEEFSEFVDNDNDSLVEGVDWLKLAVTARTKKYGDDIPIDQKEKARQLRFLQYRGFKTDICFQALKYTLDTLDERF